MDVFQKANSGNNQFVIWVKYFQIMANSIFQYLLETTGVNRIAHSDCNYADTLLKYKIYKHYI